MNKENKIIPGDLVKYSNILNKGVILDGAIFLETNDSAGVSTIESKAGYVIKYTSKNFPLLYVGPVARREYPNTLNVFCDKKRVCFHKFLYDEEVLVFGVPFKTSYRKILPNGNESLNMQCTIKNLEQIFYTVSPSSIYNHENFSSREFK